MMPSNYIIHGNSLNEMKRIPNDYVSCCVTEPPAFKSALGKAEDYIASLQQVFDEVKRVLRPDGTAWVVLRDTYVNKNLVGIPWKVAFKLQESGWLLRQDVVLHRMNSAADTLHDRCTRAHDYIMTFTKSTRYYFDREAIADATVLEPERKKCLTKDLSLTIKKDRRSVWSITSDISCPTEIVERCVLAGCPEGGLVLDPFFGSGTVGLVAAKNNRQFIGIDNDEHCCRIASQRIDSAFDSAVPQLSGKYSMEDLSWE